MLFGTHQATIFPEIKPAHSVTLYDAGHDQTYPSLSFYSSQHIDKIQPSLLNPGTQMSPKCLIDIDMYTHTHIYFTVRYTVHTEQYILLSAPLIRRPPLLSFVRWQRRDR